MLGHCAPLGLLWLRQAWVTWTFFFFNATVLGEGGFLFLFVYLFFF